MANETAKYVITAENQTGPAFAAIKRSLGDVQQSAVGLKTAFAGIAGALSLGAFADIAKEMVTSAAALDDFSEKTGASVENLSRLQQVARIGGADFQGVTDVMVRLSRALAGADEESKGAGLALARLGLNAAELRKQDPSEALRRVALELNKYADGGGKAALVTELLGKSGAQYLPFLKDLATETGITAKVTTAQAAEAEKLEKALKRLSSESYNVKQSFLLGLVPALNSTIEQFKEGIRIAGGFGQAILQFGKFNTSLDAGGQLADLQKQLQGEELNKSLQIKAGTVDTSGLDAGIAATKRQIEFVKFLQRQQALANASGDTPGERARSGARALPELDFVKPGPKGPKERDPFEEALKQLKLEAIRVDDLSKRFEMLKLIEEGIYGKDLSQAKKDALELGAQEVDASRERVTVAKENKKAQEDLAAFAVKNQDLFTNGLRQLEDEADALRVVTAETKVLRDLERGRYGERSASERKALVDRAKSLDLLRIELDEEKEFRARREKFDQDTDRKLREQQQPFEDGIRAITNGLEDAIRSGNKLRDVFRGIAQDLLKIFIKDQITKPLEELFRKNFGGAVGDADGGILGAIFKGIGGLFNSAPGAANGAQFTVPGSGGTDSQLLAMRVTPGEDVTIRTPAQQRAGQGGGVTIIQHNTFGSDVNRATLSAWARQMKNETLAAVADSATRGGAFASAVRG